MCLSTMAVLRFCTASQLRVRRVDVVDAVLGGVLEVVPEFGVEEQGLGGDAADVQAGAAEDVGGFDERDLEAELSGANGRRVAGRAAADDCHVIDCVCQSELRSRALHDAHEQRSFHCSV